MTALPSAPVLAAFGIRTPLVRLNGGQGRAFSLHWRPAGFATAVVVGDAIRWAEADPEPLVASTRHVEGFAQLYVRAAIFRLVTTLPFGGDVEPYRRDLETVSMLGA